MALTRDALFWNAFAGHAERTVRASKLLAQMIDDPTRAEGLAAEITKLENEGDTITHDTVAALHHTWITPLDREEIHALISSLDDVLDTVEAASERIALYGISTTTAEAQGLAALVVRSAEDMHGAVTKLSSMKQSAAILELCKSINQYESEADAILRRGLARLFREETDALTVIKWRDIYEVLESATDRAEDAANVIEGIVLEHS